MYGPCKPKESEYKSDTNYDHASFTHYWETAVSYNKIYLKKLRHDTVLSRCVSDRTLHISGWSKSFDISYHSVMQQKLKAHNVLNSLQNQIKHLTIQLNWLNWVR
jgi:predicted outer membrane protein